MSRYPMILAVVLGVTAGHTSVGWAAAQSQTAPSTAQAEWAKSFGAEALNSHLHGNNLSIGVVAAGDNISEARAAADSLSAGLKSAARCAKVVRDDRGGATASLADAAIVALLKGSAEKLDQVFIVRVFVDAGTTSAVVTGYDLAGTVLGAFSTTRGQALAARVESTGSGDGIAQAVTLVHEKTVDRKAAEEEYEKRMVWFQDMVGVSANSGMVVSSWTTPYKGKYKERFEDDGDFFNYVGRADLAKIYSKRETYGYSWGLLKGLGWTTAVLGLSMGGLFYAIEHEGEGSFQSTGEKLRLVGAVGLGVGILGSIGMAFAPDYPESIEPPAIRRMADEYNKKLRVELGLEERSAASEEKAPEKTGMRFAWSPLAMPGGAGLLVGAQF